MNSPKPTALKVLQGTTRKDRTNNREPKPRRGARKPRGMSEMASAKWDELAPRLRRLGLLGETHADALEMLCETYASWKQRAKSSDYHDQAAAGRDRESLLKLLAHFGMTPSSQTRVAVQSGEDVDPIENWESGVG